MSTIYTYNSLAIPIKNQGIKSKETVINNNVWIGVKVTILYGNTLKRSSIVAESSVVTKDSQYDTILEKVAVKILMERT